MNKAFIRDPDQTAERCPRCGSLGQTVAAPTLDALLPAEVRRRLPDTANFCPLPSCEVAYFDMFEQSVSTGELNCPVYPKDLEAPICPCLGLTRADVERDVREGVVTRVKAALEHAKSPEARCMTMAANGQPCVAAVQRYYMKCRGESS
jgi:hypothetical protein